MDSTSSKFFEILSSWSSPVFILVIIALVVIALIYYLNRYVVKPTEEKHLIEKQEIELKNSQLMALFATLDPDPIIRINADGEILFFNNAASKILNVKTGELITNHFTNIKEIKSKIENNLVLAIPVQINDIHFDGLMVGNSDLNIAQIYLRDISTIKSLEIKLKQLSQYLQNQIDEERYRIANELHDGVVQELYLIRMGMNKIEEENRLDQDTHMTSVKLQLKSLSDELRRIIYDLKPKVLDEMGLEPALNTLCNNVSAESGIAGSIQLIGFTGRLNKKHELFFYRIIQEGLSNIIKHSGASEFSVFMVKNDSSIKAIITDNGCGLKEKHSDDNTKHFGLMNIRERTEGLGGTLKINSNTNEGVTLIAEIPYNS
ncbi:MAG: sensor histidine kinase [Ignavibacteriales bacterium]|nr:MAG: sensor histidine kinase [Ignavibacteriales bacterium]